MGHLEQAERRVTKDQRTSGSSENKWHHQEQQAHQEQVVQLEQAERQAHQGTSGTTGTSGTSGTSGTTGTSGTSGTSGSSGTSALSLTKLEITGDIDGSNTIFTISQTVATLNHLFFGMVNYNKKGQHIP
jgi:hypothetical protein